MTTESVDAVLGPGGPIARRLPGYEVRPEQVELSRAVADALRERTHLLAEAGTGVGKSFAYLLPAVLHAVAHAGSGPIVVSTRTIALQEQLDRKDLPFLQSVLPLEWSAVTAIGRNNYLCLRRLDLAQRERASLFADATHEQQLADVVTWAATTREGTRLDLPGAIDAAVWEEVRAEHGNCLQRACKYYEPCHWQRARRRMDGAQILVVNHSLYMADVALRMAGSAYLPAHSVVIFDEAHHLERVATESLGLRLTRGVLGWHLKRLHARGERSLLVRASLSHAVPLHQRLREAVDEFFAGLDVLVGDERDAMLGLDDRAFDDPLSEPLLQLASTIEDGAERVGEVDLKMELASRARGLRTLQTMVDNLARPGVAGTVRWLERGRGGAELRAAPIEVRGALAAHVFGGGRTAVLVSATLGAGADPEFGWLREQLGIGKAKTLRLGSPFDYAQQMRVVVAEGMPDPARDPKTFEREAIDAIRRHVLDNGGRAVVLCTSWRFVQALGAALLPSLTDAGIPLLVQGAEPIGRLLQRKLAEPTSVLIGTDSLWEGIDLPGDALTLVVITKFPFQQPGHPLTQARIRAIEAKGGNGFRDHSLPEAILKFRQGVGRLIRSRSDHGRIVILDPRARTKAYGRQFLAALPVGARAE